MRKHACIDGPELDAHIIDWGKSLPRFSQFKAQEQEIRARHGINLAEAYPVVSGCSLCEAPAFQEPQALRGRPRSCVADAFDTASTTALSELRTATNSGRADHLRQRDKPRHPSAVDLSG